ncbi:MAG: hypothetical protein KTR30_27895 [Saprospiraceae bacterium]|nr:hypothetical protein [Saprospiraceae bacterium]
MMNGDQFEQIERFLDGEISRKELGETLSDFSPEALDTEITSIQNMRTAVEAAGLRDQLMATLPKASTQQPKVRRLIPWRQSLAIAASVLVLILAYFFWPNPEEAGLYAKYEYVDPGLPVLMSQSDDHAMYDALTYYGEADYATAISKLSALQKEGVNNDTIAYYLGASYLYEEQTRAAMESLAGLTEGTGPFQARAEWLAILAALQVDDMNQVRSRLPAILADEAHPFHNDAQQLQTDLPE